MVLHLSYCPYKRDRNLANNKQRILCDLSEYEIVRNASKMTVKSKTVNRIVGVATLAVATGRHAIQWYIYSQNLYRSKRTIEPSQKGVAQSLAHGDASPHHTHYYL
ncbi:hypothetical protein EVAR_38397_1 [Eumeta japonica]|uniref:Uncharacterized protein n=1 Tax=Eumeta variegata TaxID=151549 RepID=A0A4C1YJ90_EUMVA|nr:hypothetical protein EVAR_38397_1 [Eumeta japonica]